MTERSLQERLAELRSELESTEALDEQSRELLDALHRDIEQLLERSALRDGGEADDDGDLLDRLREAARHFEESHPALTSAVGRVADALSSLGI